MRAIRHLVAAAVNGLKPQRVSVVDETGRLLADGSADDAGGATADERKIAYERRLREQVESIVTSVVGPGHARVQLTADFDFNRITQTSDKFDPESRVVRSSQTREEVDGEQRRQRRQRFRSATSCRAPTPAPRRAQQQRDQNRKTEEIVNYEISRTTKTEVIEGGRVNRISVAVVVDGIYAKNDKGELTYQPRGKEEIDRIAALVRTAIGFDAKRGDQVEVANLRLAETPSDPDQRADRLDEHAAVHQGRHHARHRARRDVAARPPRAAARRAADDPAHHHARRRARGVGGAAGVRHHRRTDRRRGRNGRHRRRRHARRRRRQRHRRRQPAASPRPAAPTSRSSAATRRSRSPTAPRR